MKIFILALLAILFLSCRNTNFVEIPFFEIELELSEMAERRLLQDRETIIIAAYFHSLLSRVENIENLPRRYRRHKNQHMGEISILSHSIEITDNRLVRFENLKMSKYLYNLLGEKNIFVLINVFSGRRSTNLNILHCAILIAPLNKFREKRFTLNGGLIGEEIIINNIIR